MTPSEPSPLVSFKRIQGSFPTPWVIRYRDQQDKKKKEATTGGRSAFSCDCLMLHKSFRPPPPSTPAHIQKHGRFPVFLKKVCLVRLGVWGGPLQKGVINYVKPKGRRTWHGLGSTCHGCKLPSMIKHRALHVGLQHKVCLNKTPKQILAQKANGKERALLVERHAPKRKKVEATHWVSESNGRGARRLAHRKHCQLPGEGHDLLALALGSVTAPRKQVLR